MKNKTKGKLIRSIFMCLISTIFASLCLSFAWFAFPRMVDSSSTNIRLIGLIGDAYYYQGNYNQSGELSGFLGDAPQASSGKDFTKYDPSDTSVAPFAMASAKPSSRFLFYFKLRLTNDSATNVHINILDWISTTSEEQPKEGNNPIYLTKAIYMYAPEAPTVFREKAAEETPEAYETAFKAAARTAAIDNFGDALMVDGPGHANYANNRFKQSSKHNKVSDAMDAALKAPVTLRTYTFQPSTTYIVPFMMEFTNHQDTYYKPDTNPNTYIAWNNPSAPEEVKKFNSNVYKGMSFTINTLEITFVDPQ